MSTAPATPSLPPHFRCNCVPDLGPAHCHRCSQRNSQITTWDEAGCASFIENLDDLIDPHAEGVAEAIDVLMRARPAPALVTVAPVPAPVTRATPAPKPSTSKPSVPKPGPPAAAPRWRFTNLALTQLDDLQISKDEITEKVKSADMSMPSADGNAHNYYYGDLLILVDDTCVISVVQGTQRPDGTVKPDRSGQSKPVKRKKISGGPGRKMPDSTKEMGKLLKAKGFEIEQLENNHLRATHPHHTKRSFVLSSSPSDHLSWKNSIAEIRRHTGIDITASRSAPRR